MLEDEQYDVEVAFNGKQALNKMNKNIPDLFIRDNDAQNEWI